MNQFSVSIVTSSLSRDVNVFFSYSLISELVSTLFPEMVLSGFHRFWVISVLWSSRSVSRSPEKFWFDSGMIFQWHYCILVWYLWKSIWLLMALGSLPHPLLIGLWRLLCSFCFYKTFNKENSKTWENFWLEAESTIAKLVCNSISSKKGLFPP